MRVASQAVGPSSLVKMVCGHLDTSCNKDADSEAFKQSLFRATALLISTWEQQGEGGSGDVRQLLHAVCWAPIKHFTESAMEAAIACWEWLLAARSDLSAQVL